MAFHCSVSPNHFLLLVWLGFWVPQPLFLPLMSPQEKGEHGRDLLPLDGNCHLLESFRNRPEKNLPGNLSHTIILYVHISSFWIVLF